MKVLVSIEGRWRVDREVEMTREQYEALDARLDEHPKGYKREQLAEEVMDACNLRIQDGDVENLEIVDIFEVGVEDTETVK